MESEEHRRLVAEIMAALRLELPLLMAHALVLARAHRQQEQRRTEVAIIPETFDRWLAACVITATREDFVSGRDLYRSWWAWCEEHGEQAGTHTTLSRMLKRKGFTYEKNGPVDAKRRGRGFRRLKLTH